MEDIPKKLSDSIFEDYRIISVKINYAKGEYDEDDKESPPDEFHSVKAYFNSHNLEVVYSSMGLHLNGENKKPHVHYHLIVKSLPTGTFQSNNSLHRSRWLAKEGNEVHSFENVSIRFPRKKEDPVWQVLSYPFKEGYAIKKGTVIPQEYLSFLIDYGKNLYQVSLGDRARNDASDERKKQSLLLLGTLCKENTSHFKNWREMVEWLEDNYLSTLSLEEKPDFPTYVKNCQKVGNHLGMFRYCDRM